MSIKPVFNIPSNFKLSRSFAPKLANDNPLPSSMVPTIQQQCKASVRASQAAAQSIETALAHLRPRD